MIGNENQGLGTSLSYRTCTRYSNFEKNWITIFAAWITLL